MIEQGASLTRRDLLRLAAVAGLVVMRGRSAQAASLAPGGPPAAEVLQRLLEGNQRFVKGETASPRRGPDDFRPLAEGQRPVAVIVGCADSRVPPELLFDRGIDSARQLEETRTALSVTDAQLETARQAASLVHAGARPEDLRAAQIKVEQARDALAAARLTGEAKVAQARAALRQAQQGILQVAAKRQDAAAMRRSAEQKRADLAAAQASAGYAQLRSPLTGVVARRLLNPGDTADTTSPVLEACRPFARGFGLETAMTMDAVRLGFRVGERAVEMHHRSTGMNAAGFLHRAVIPAGTARAFQPHKCRGNHVSGHLLGQILAKLLDARALG